LTKNQLAIHGAVKIAKTSRAYIFFAKIGVLTLKINGKRGENVDRTTLGYMKDRVAKASKIVRKIEGLTKIAYRMLETDTITFSENGSTHGILHSKSYNDELDSKGLLKEINSLVIAAINKDIERLEHELAQL
jgi:hypothetical protein